MMGEVPRQNVAHGEQVRTAMVIDDALWIAGGAGGIIEGNGSPLVRGRQPRERRIARGEKTLVVQFAQRLAPGPRLRVVDIDDDDPASQLFEGRFDDVGEFPVGDEDARVPVFEAVRDGRGIRAGIQGIQHRPRHRHPEMGLVQFGRVGRHDRHRISLADPARG